ncbi:MAG: hypothetical protein ACREV7_17130 [Steroidobacteraceae bacterium]
MKTNDSQSRNIAAWWLASAVLLTAACRADQPRVANEPIPTIAPVRAGFSPARLGRLDRWIDAQIAERHEAGAVVLIARHGRIAYLPQALRERGFADSGKGRHAMDDDHSYSG